MTKQQLIGKWKLVEMVHEKDGRKFWPMGKNASGVLEYFDQGDRMHVRITRNAKLDGAPDATDGPFAGAVMEYSGRYRIQGEAIVHAIQESTYPGWKGKEEPRPYEFQGNRLILTAKQKNETGTIIWQKE